MWGFKWQENFVREQFLKNFNQQNTMSLLMLCFECKMLRFKNMITKKCCGLQGFQETCLHGYDRTYGNIPLASH
jgi:hypothetical protein